MNNFSEGGWAGWIAITQSDSNPYGIFLSASDQMASQIIAAQTNAQTKASWGKGFLSQEVCVETDGTLLAECKQTYPGQDKWCEQITCEKTEIQTPGTTIENRLTSALGSDFGRLISAKEIDEVFSALFNQLIEKGIGAIGKAIGGGGSSNYDQQVAAEKKQYLEGQRANSIDMINSSIAVEQDFSNTKQKSFDLITSIVAKLGELKICAPARAVEIDASISDFNAEQDDVQKDIDATTPLITQAGAYKTQINTAATYEELQSILDNFNNVMQPQLHTADDISKANEEYGALTTILDNISAELDTCLGH
jgi:hypothetical protein